MQSADEHLLYHSRWLLVASRSACRRSPPGHSCGSRKYTLIGKPFSSFWELCGLCECCITSYTLRTTDNLIGCWRHATGGVKYDQGLCKHTLHLTSGAWLVTGTTMHRAAARHSQVVDNTNTGTPQVLNGDLHRKPTSAKWWICTSMTISMRFA